MLQSAPQSEEASIDDELTFGQWLQRRRQAPLLTQQQLGHLAGCSTETIRKYEAETRRPSADVARMLASALQLPAAEQGAFARFARGQRADAPAVPSVAALPLPGGALRRQEEAPSNLPIPLTPL